MTVIIDSDAWIEFFTAGQQGPKVKEVLGGGRPAVTPDLVLAEVCRKFDRDGLDRPTIESRLRVMRGLSGIAEISLAVALAVPQADKDLRATARAKRTNMPGLGDAIILATARARNGTVLTGDPHFKDIPETEWLG
ncbi:MAG TPA: PIN domain-containing protein [Thermoplasmata archaeon]|nr:PIN domain-containing protein [Thermoplasmata archaeon]